MYLFFASEKTSLKPWIVVSVKQSLSMNGNKTCGYFFLFPSFSLSFFCLPSFFLNFFIFVFRLSSFFFLSFYPCICFVIFLLLFSLWSLSFFFSFLLTLVETHTEILSFLWNLKVKSSFSFLLFSQQSEQDLNTKKKMASNWINCSFLPRSLISLSQWCHYKLQQIWPCLDTNSSSWMLRASTFGDWLKNKWIKSQRKVTRCT